MRGWPRSRKLRGGRRYFARLASWPDRVDAAIDLGPGAWYDLWHEHPDFTGWSLGSGAARHAHRRVLFAAFDRLMARAEASARDVQVFASVQERDSPGDAIYLHTPNPNGTPFPFTWPGVDFGGMAPRWLEPYLDRSRVEVGRGWFDGDTYYVVVPLGPHGRGAGLR